MCTKPTKTNSGLHKTSSLQLLCYTEVCATGVNWNEKKKYCHWLNECCCVRQVGCLNKHHCFDRATKPQCLYFLGRIKPTNELLTVDSAFELG